MARSERLGSHLKLRDLRIFMAVASAGTMGRAAAELAVSQPVISKAIADLEYTLGVRLFDRSRRGVELTVHGQSLRESGIAVFDDLKQSVARLEALSDPTVGEVRIGTTLPLAGGLVSAAVDRMCARYPKMKFHVIEASRNALRVRELPARNIDFAVSHIYESLSNDEFAVEELFEDAYVVHVGRNSKWTKRRHVRLADLMNEPWVLPPQDIQLPLHKAFYAAGLEPPSRSVVTLSVQVHNSLLATGRFVTALPSSTFGWSTAHLPLKALPIEMPTTTAPIAFIALKGRKLSGAAMLFRDCLRELVAKRQKSIR